MCVWMSLPPSFRSTEAVYTQAVATQVMLSLNPEPKATGQRGGFRGKGGPSSLLNSPASEGKAVLTAQTAGHWGGHASPFLEARGKQRRSGAATIFLGSGLRQQKMPHGRLPPLRSLLLKEEL